MLIIIFLGATALLWVIRGKKTISYHRYVYGKVTMSFIIAPIIYSVVVSLFFVLLFSPSFLVNLQAETYAILENSQTINLLDLVVPGIFFGNLLFHFTFYTNKLIKSYKGELANINKFCSFFSYNLGYNENLTIIVNESLKGIEQDYFANEFRDVYQQEDKTLEERFDILKNKYTYKFFEMYLSIVKIVASEGVNENYLKSLDIVQKLGDEYYKQVDALFKNKQKAVSQVRLILVVVTFIPFLMKKNVGDLFVPFLNGASGYVSTLIYYLVIVAIFCIVNKSLQNNKVIRKEGRYV